MYETLNQIGQKWKHIVLSIETVQKLIRQIDMLKVKHHARRDGAIDVGREPEKAESESWKLSLIQPKSWLASMNEPVEQVLPRVWMYVRSSFPPA